MNARITIDRNIKFTSHFNSNFYSVPDKLILEIKSKDKKFNILDGKFPFIKGNLPSSILNFLSLDLISKISLSGTL